MKYYFTSEGYCHKELLRRCCRHPGSASDGSAIYTRHSLGLLLQNRKIVYIFVEEDPGLLSIFQMDLFEWLVSLVVSDLRSSLAASYAKR